MRMCLDRTRAAPAHAGSNIKRKKLLLREKLRYAQQPARKRWRVRRMMIGETEIKRDG